VLYPPSHLNLSFFGIWNLLDQKECETTLESFLNEAYEGYILKPKNQIERLTQEDDYGNIEYKLKLVNPTSDRVAHLTTQMKFRLQEGHGEAKYEIGVEDDGTPTGLCKEDMFYSLNTLCYMASNLKADLIILKMRDGYEGKSAEVLVRSNHREGIKLDIKIMLLGDKQSGKSTLIGVLTSGQLDDGNGSARMYVHQHKHEIISGETSSLSHHVRRNRSTLLNPIITYMYIFLCVPMFRFLALIVKALSQIIPTMVTLVGSRL
jgi:hypothetical protein